MGDILRVPPTSRGAALARRAATLLPSRACRAITRYAHMAVVMGRKPGVSEPSVIKEFVAKAGANLIVVDARNTGAWRPARSFDCELH